ncbi:MAG: helix-hairpin-helix domain-containing protein [Bacteroidaceae bacterium]
MKRFSLFTIGIYTICSFIPTRQLKAQKIPVQLQQRLEEAAEHGIFLEDEIEALEEARLTIRDSLWTGHPLTQLEALTTDGPLDINQASYEQFLALQTLTENQIDEIMYYRYMRHGFKEVDNLLMLPSMDMQTYKRLSPLICTRPIQSQKIPSLHNIMKYGHHQLIGDFMIPTYKRAGFYKPASATSKDINNYFQGDSWSQTIRYRWQYRQQIQVGLTVQQDVGEPFGKMGNNLGYDFISPYFFMKDIGRIEALAIGNYRANFGCGLILNQGFSIGKYGGASALSDYRPTLSKHSSSSEVNFMQGIGTTLKLGDSWHLTGLLSSRSIDATISHDTITAIQQSGEHRTWSEIQRKNAASQQVAASHIEYKPYNGATFSVGASLLYTHFNHPYWRPFREYNKNYFRGQSLTTGGINYKYHHQLWFLSGEVAADSQQGYAMIQSIQYYPFDGWRFYTSLRYYSENYHPLFASSLEEGGRIANEQGIYVGFEANPWTKINIEGYVDYFKFPKPTYSAFLPSDGVECALSIRHQTTNQLQLGLRYRFKTKGKNKPKTSYSDYMHIMEQYLTLQVRGDVTWEPSASWRVQTKSYLTLAGYKDNQPQHGYLEAISLRYHATTQPFELSGQIAYFDTQGYDSRMYIYEPGLLYHFSFPMLYGQGWRYTTIAHFALSSHVKVTAQWRESIYNDRITISSGINEIKSNRQGEGLLQVQVNL